MDEQNQNPAPQSNYPEPETPAYQAEEQPVIPGDLEPSTEGGQPPVFGTPSTLPEPSAVQDIQSGQPPVEKKRKKWPIVAGVAALLVVLLGAGSVLAYTFWYQNPQRVIMDGLSKALQAETITYTATMKSDSPAEGADFTLDITGAAADGNGNVDVKAKITAESVNYEFGGKGVFDKEGALYVRFENLDEAMKSYLETSSEMGMAEGIDELVDMLVAKFNDRWIKITQSDLKGYGSGDDALGCLRQASDAFRNNQDAQKELAALYEKHPFIRIDENLGTKDGSIGYAISPDEAKEKAFWAGMKKSKFYEKLDDCDTALDEADVEDEDETVDTLKNARTEIWVSQWQHEITRVTMQGEDEDGAKMDLSWQPRFNQEVTISIPKESVTLSELMEDLQGVFMQYVMSQMETAPTDDQMFGQSL